MYILNNLLYSSIHKYTGLEETNLHVHKSNCSSFTNFLLTLWYPLKNYVIISYFDKFNNVRVINLDDQFLKTLQIFKK